MPKQMERATRDDALRPLVEANNGFAIDLYHHVAKKNEGDNFFFSPYSMSSALMIAAEGARDETAVEMGTVLRLPSDLRRGERGEGEPWNLEPLHAGIGQMDRELRVGGGRDEPLHQEIRELRAELDSLSCDAPKLADERQLRESFRVIDKAEDVASRLNRLFLQVDRYELRIANAIWAERTYPFRDEFLDTIEKYYETGVARVADFKSQGEAARRQINEWVEEITHRRITNLVPAGWSRFGRTTPSGETSCSPTVARQGRRS
jgi:hypothetical protein